MKKPLSHSIRKLATTLSQWTPQDLQPKHSGVAALNNLNDNTILALSSIGEL